MKTYFDRHIESDNLKQSISKLSDSWYWGANGRCSRQSSEDTSMFAVRPKGRPVDERIDTVRLEFEVLLDQPVQQLGTGKGLHDATEIGFSTNLQDESKDQIPAAGGKTFAENLSIGRGAGFGTVDRMRDGQVLVVVKCVVRPGRLPLGQGGPVISLRTNSNSAIRIKAILWFGLMSSWHEVA